MIPTGGMNHRPHPGSDFSLSPQRLGLDWSPGNPPSKNGRRESIPKMQVTFCICLLLSVHSFNPRSLPQSSPPSCPGTGAQHGHAQTQQLPQGEHHGHNQHDDAHMAGHGQHEAVGHTTAAHVPRQEAWWEDAAAARVRMDDWSAMTATIWGDKRCCACAELAPWAAQISAS
jgi:hypothetical protein